MPSLLVRIKKKNDGSAALSCQRADGSVTWQRQDGQLGRFFPPHDLTHFAVESVLGVTGGFFGMIAGGRDINQTALASVPPEAHFVEVTVGFFDLELRTEVLGSAADLQWKLEGYFADKKLPMPPIHVTDEQIAAIRVKRGELFGLWQALPVGETLELRFQ